MSRIARCAARSLPSRSCCVTLPVWVGNSYYINIASQILIWAVLALALNVLVGYAGLTSLGHAGLFAMAGYAAALLLAAGHGHFAADLGGACSSRSLASAVFAVLALRATGIGFLMITLAIGQILWGIAYRWASLTNGDNGINVSTPAGAVRAVSLAAPPAFYYATLVVFLLAVVSMAVFVRSPFGASLRGTRDQAAPHDRARLQRLADPVPGHPVLRLLGRRRRLLFIYYNQFISPQVGGADHLGRSAADGDLGRQRHAARTDRRRRHRGDHEERGQRLHRALEPGARRRSSSSSSASCRRGWCRARCGCGARAGSALRVSDRTAAPRGSEQGCAGERVP